MLHLLAGSCPDFLLEVSEANRASGNCLAGPQAIVSDTFRSMIMVLAIRDQADHNEEFNLPI
jgi:hypothetical protein